MARMKSLRPQLMAKASRAGAKVLPYTGAVLGAGAGTMLAKGYSDWSTRRQNRDGSYSNAMSLAGYGAAAAGTGLIAAGIGTKLYNGANKALSDSYWGNMNLYGKSAVGTAAGLVGLNAMYRGFTGKQRDDGTRAGFGTFLAGAGLTTVAGAMTRGSMASIYANAKTNPRISKFMSGMKGKAGALMTAIKANNAI